MEEEVVSILPPIVADVLLILSIALGIILLVAFSYLWSARRQDREDIEKLMANMKDLSKKIKDLETSMNETSDSKKVEELPEVEPFGIAIDKKTESDKHNEEKTQQPWDSFIEDYNHIAKSMAVPGQLKACENFVKENGLKILIYDVNIKFIAAKNVSESRFWAWTMEGSNEYIVVPNPMITYDEELHNQPGMQKTFETNYENGKYNTYYVKNPAIFICNDKNEWQILELGILKLER